MHKEYKTSDLHTREYSSAGQRKVLRIELAASNFCPPRNFVCLKFYPLKFCSIRYAKILPPEKVYMHIYQRWISMVQFYLNGKLFFKKASRLKALMFFSCDKVSISL